MEMIFIANLLQVLMNAVVFVLLIVVVYHLHSFKVLIYVILKIAKEQIKIVLNVFMEKLDQLKLALMVMFVLHIAKILTMHKLNKQMLLLYLEIHFHKKVVIELT